MASLGLFLEPKLIEEDFACINGFRREDLVFRMGGLQGMRRFRRGDVGFVGRVAFYLWRMGMKGGIKNDVGRLGNWGSSEWKEEFQRLGNLQAQVRRP